MAEALREQILRIAALSADLPVYEDRARYGGLDTLVACIERHLSE